MNERGVDFVAFDHPFKKPVAQFKAMEGMTIADLIRESDIDPSSYLNMQVTVSIGSRTSEIQMNDWHRVRPRRGCFVRVTPLIQGPLIAPLLGVVFAAAAPTLAGMLFPTLLAGSLGLALATAAISVVGTLLIRALVPPPKQASAGSVDDPVFTLTGASNNAKPYGVYPTVIGRHIMFPSKTATGYTETVEDEIYLRERMTFGYGPVSLAELKIGTTPITEFEGVQIEFLNVDRALTVANIPNIEDYVVDGGWRYGTEAMSLYPSDIAEDNYSVVLEYVEPVVRQTRINTSSANVDISFQGLAELTGSTKIALSVSMLVEYRAVGDTVWIEHESKVCTESTTSYVRFTSTIDFPAPGQYEVQVTRLTPDDNGRSQYRSASSLSAIRSIQTGSLPSHSDISEIAIRIKASGELNGQVESLNAVAQQLARVWDGTQWSTLQPVRHPAWQFAAALQGSQLRDPVSDDQIALDELKSWYDAFPHWTCDTVIDSATRLGDVLDLICATGRVRRGMSNLKYSVIQDGAASGVTQHFTPRNSWGFTGRRFLDRAIHAFRVRVVSERAGWAQTEFLVYMDGFDASNATEIETLSLPGIVVGLTETTGGNAWRLGRYHLAVATLRPEEFHFNCDLDHIPCQMGDKIRVVHDVPLFGVGAGRIKAVEINGLGEMLGFTLDENLQTEAALFYRIRIRKSNGSELILAGQHLGDGAWSFSSLTYEHLVVGDLVMIELMTEETVELVITGVTHTGNLQAKVSAVPAAPEVLTADGGVIPDYDAQISTPVRYGPSKPVILDVRSGSDVAIVEADNSLTARIGVTVGTINDVSNSTILTSIRWRKVGSSRWVYSTRKEYQSEVFTDALENGPTYQIAVASFNLNGDTRGWSNAGTFQSTTSGNILPAPLWSSTPNIDTITLLGPSTINIDRAEYRIYAATADSVSLTMVGQSVTSNFTYNPASTGYTRYKVVAVTHGGVEGEYSGFISVIPDGIPAEVTDGINEALATAETARDDIILAQNAIGDVQTNLTNEIAGLQVDYTAGNAAVAKAKEIARDMLPYDFSEGTTYFSPNIGIAPSASGDLDPAIFTFSNGVVQFEGSGVGNRLLAPKGVMRVVVGRTYRVSVEVRQIAGVNRGTAHYIQMRRNNDNYTGSTNSTRSKSIAALGVWSTLVEDFEVLTSMTNLNWRPLFYVALTSQVGDIYEVRTLRMEDISEQVAASEFKLAAETAEANASLSEIATATAETNAEGSAALAQQGAELAVQIGPRGASVTSDTLFTDYDGSGGWATWTKTPNLTDNELYPAGKTIEFVFPLDTDRGGATINSTNVSWKGATNADAYVVEFEFTLVSGTSAGAGLLFDWNGGGGNTRVSKHLADIVRVPIEIGKVHTAQAVCVMPVSFDEAQFTSNTIYLMGNYINPKASKSIKFHSCRVRVATDEELGTGQVGASIAAAVATESTARILADQALANFANTLDADIGSLSATVTQQGTAFASLDGVVQAMTGMTATTEDVNGVTRIASVFLTSYANPDGTGGTAIQANADNFIANGTMSAEKLTVGLGSNLIENSTFTMGIDQITKSGTGGSYTGAFLGRREINQSFSGSTYPTLYVYQNNSATDGYLDIKFNSLLQNGTYSFLSVPVKAENYYEFSANISFHRCTATMYVFWYSASGVYLGAGGLAVTGGQVSSTNPDEWDRVWSKPLLAPVGAAYALPLIRKFGTNSGGDSYLFIHKPMCCISHVSAVEPAPWTPSGTTLITGEGIVANSVTADKLVVNDIVVTGTMIAPNAVTDHAYGYISNITVPSNPNGSTSLSDYLVLDFGSLDVAIPARAGYRRDAEIGYDIVSTTTGGTVPDGGYIGQVSVGLMLAGAGGYAIVKSSQTPMWAIDDYAQSGTLVIQDFAATIGATSYDGFGAQNGTDRPLSITMRVTVRETKL